MHLRARVPTAMLFFCCHKCHIKGEIDAKTVVFWGEMTKQNRTFSSFVHRIWVTWMSDLLKYALSWCSILITSTLRKCCDTCDSKKAKTPVLRAYACAWEEIVFTNLTLMNTLHLVCAMYWKFSKKKPLFYSTFYQVAQKVASSQSILHKEVFIQHVVLKKTTCCFIENDVLFCGKRRVVL